MPEPNRRTREWPGSRINLFDVSHRVSPVYCNEGGREGHDRLDPAISEVVGAHEEGVIELLDEAALP